jgi:hypothetical protein
MNRYIIAVDSTKAVVADVVKELKKMKISVVEALDLINTIVINANEKQVLKIKKQIEGILSIDIEGQLNAI